MYSQKQTLGFRPRKEDVKLLQKKKIDPVLVQNEVTEVKLK